MAAKRMQATSSIETGALTLGQCDASFLINSQPGNQSVASGAQVALLAGDATASSYTWTVTASPPDSEYVLTGADQAEAVLTPKTPGAYTIQLRVAKADCEALAPRYYGLPRSHNNIACLPPTNRYSSTATPNGPVICYR